MLIYEHISAKKPCRMGISTSLSEIRNYNFISYTPACGGEIASAAVVSCLQGAPKVSCFLRDFAENLIGY